MDTNKPDPGTKCPKCSYVRQPSDSMIGLDECPACGVLYAKAMSTPNRQPPTHTQIDSQPGLRKQVKSGPDFQLRFIVYLVLCIVCILLSYHQDKKFKENAELEHLRIMASGRIALAKAYLESTKESKSPTSVILFSAFLFFGATAYLSRKKVLLSDFFFIRARSSDSGDNRISLLAKCILYGIFVLLVLNIMLRVIIFVFGFGQALMEKAEPTATEVTPPIEKKIVPVDEKVKEKPKNTAAELYRGMPVGTYLGMVHEGITQYIIDNPGRTLRDEDLDAVLNGYLLLDELIWLRRNDHLRIKADTPTAFEIAIYNGKKWSVMDQDKHRRTASSF